MSDRQGMLDFNWAADRAGGEHLTFAELSAWISRSELILLKKLSRNDISWAFPVKGSKQDGVYVPAEVRDAFFPGLTNVNRNKTHIREVPHFPTIWPQAGESPRDTRIVHYSNKGPETHFTRVPAAAFAELSPASLLVGGRLAAPSGGAQYWFATVDSVSEEAEALETVLDLPSTFSCGLFSPSQFRGALIDESSELIEEILEGISKGKLPEFIKSAAIPASQLLAREAQTQYLVSSGSAGLDPFKLGAPGDVLMKLSRDIEYRTYKRHERRKRAADVLRIIIGGGGLKGGASLVGAVVSGFAELNDTFLSAGQQRKSRGGLSFERHIGAMLKAGGIPFQEQIITGSRRPDFVLPNVAMLKAKDRNFEAALVLAAKTTLRERWKQVMVERLNCDVFLATVDDRVSGQAIEEMATSGVKLVVPESLKESKETWYKSAKNVITFRDFFQNEVAGRCARYWSAPN